MTIFGNRDSGRGGTAVAAETPSRDRVRPITLARSFGGPDIRRVILRMHGEESIVVGSAEGRDNAVSLAREMVRHIEQAAAKGDWPQIDERFIRPGAILSVDVQRVA